MALQDELDRNVEVLSTSCETLYRALADLVGPTDRESKSEMAGTGTVMGTLANITDLANEVNGMAAHLASVINQRGEIEIKAAAVDRESAKRAY